MTVEEVLLWIRRELTRLGTARGRRSAAQFFKEPVDAYGVYSSDVKRMVQEVARDVRRWPPAQRNKLCTALMRSGKIEEGALVSHLYRRFRKTCGESEFQVFEQWIDRYVRNWAHCDGTAGWLVAASIANEPSLIGRLRGWTESKNRWKRRAAAVSLVQAARHGLHTAEILDIASRLMSDGDEMVQKGVGWLLKETYPHRPGETVAFLLPWREKTSRLLLRYAAEKMTPQDREKVLA